MGKNWPALIILTLIYLFLFVVIPNLDLYTKKFNEAEFAKKYYQSQWVIPNSKNVISDEDLYAFSGFKYIKGLNPILISPEVPPLGKYLIGFSIILFNNQRIVSLIVGFLSLLIIFHIVIFSTRTFFAALVAFLLTAINTSFTDQLIHAPQLDIFQLLFLLLFIIFFIAYKKLGNKLFLFSAGLAFGYFISTKFFLLSIIIFDLTLIFFYLLSKTKFRKMFIELTFLNLISLMTFIFTYIGYFLNGGTLKGFLGVQKWIYIFYSSSKIDISKMLGNYLNLIFFNRWRFWSDGYPIIHYQYWSLLWPIIFILGLFSTYKLLKDKKYQKNDLVLFLSSFLVVYNLFLFITPIYPRYLLLLFTPFNILIGIYFAGFIKKK